MMDIFTKKLSPISVWAFTITMLALLFGCVPSPVQATELTVGVLANEFSFGALMTAYNNGVIEEYLLQLVIDRIAANPAVSMFLLGLTASQPVLGFIANRTSNPIDNIFLILLNKILQTLTYNSSKNQPDVLDWKVMLTNKPSTWPDLIESKSAIDIVTMQDRLFYRSDIRA